MGRVTGGLSDSEPPRGWQEGVDIAPLPAKHPQGWRRVQAGEKHLVSTRRALKASRGSSDDIGLRPDRQRTTQLLLELLAGLQPTGTWN